MARILVKRPSGRCRLWCNTVDMWVSDLLDPEAMVEYLATEWVEPHTRQEAWDRINRIWQGKPYDAERLAILDRHYDSRYRALCAEDRRKRQGNATHE